MNQDQLPTRAFNEPFPNNPLATVNRQIPQSETFPEPTFPEYQRFCCVAPYAAFMDSPNPLAIRTLLNSPPGGDLALRDHEQFSIEFKQEGTLFDGQIDYMQAFTILTREQGMDSNYLVFPIQILIL